MPRSLERLQALDALRGVAALCVVVFHWKHFRSVVPLPAGIPATPLPFYGPLSVLYEYGWIAVDLFFALSGFIFHWLYARPIANRQTSTGEFFIRRFSRLYPLHVATLLFVALGQLALWWQIGSTFAYENNDAYHFLLNLFLVSEWGMADGFSFNGPSWSVSIEIALYLVFFLASRWIGAKAWVPLVGFGIGYVLDAMFEATLSRALLPFFAGGVAYFAFERIVRRDRTAIALALLAPLSVALWALAMSGVYTSLWSGHMDWVWRIHKFFTCALLFPITILCLAVLETRHATVARPVAMLGDLSYSSYLLHFPLQLLCVVLFTAVGIERSILLSPPFMLGFFAVLMPLSYASYRWFERPMQRRLRAAWQSMGTSTTVRALDPCSSGD